MEITIKIDGRMVSVEVSTEVGEFWEQGKRGNRKLYRERQRYWDGREYDEYIIATEGRLPYCASPEELLCQRETLDEIMAVRPFVPILNGSGFCSTLCMISAMRKSLCCVAAQSRLSS